MSKTKLPKLKVTEEVKSNKKKILLLSDDLRMSSCLLYTSDAADE